MSNRLFMKMTGNINIDYNAIKEDAVILKRRDWERLNEVVAERDKWLDTNSHEVRIYLERNYAWGRIEYVDVVIDEGAPTEFKDKMQSMIDGWNFELTATKGQYEEKLNLKKSIIEKYENRIKRIPKFLRVMLGLKIY